MLHLRVGDQELQGLKPLRARFRSSEVHATGPPLFLNVHEVVRISVPCVQTPLDQSFAQEDPSRAGEPPKELRDHQVLATTRRLDRLLDVMCSRDDVIDRQAELPVW